MPNRTFVIEAEGEEFPVTLSEDSIRDFRTKTADLMDRDIRNLSDSRFGPKFYLTRTNRLGVMAPILYDAVHGQDEDRIRMCVLWLAARFPEIAGAAIGENGVQFMWDSTKDVSLDALERPSYLN